MLNERTPIYFRQNSSFRPCWRTWCRSYLRRADGNPWKNECWADHQVRNFDPLCKIKMQHVFSSLLLLVFIPFSPFIFISGRSVEGPTESNRKTRKTKQAVNKRDSLKRSKNHITRRVSGWCLLLFYFYLAKNLFWNTVASLCACTSFFLCYQFALCDSFPVSHRVVS